MHEGADLVVGAADGVVGGADRVLRRGVAGIDAAQDVEEGDHGGPSFKRRSLAQPSAPGKGAAACIDSRHRRRGTVDGAFTPALAL